MTYEQEQLIKASAHLEAAIDVLSNSELEDDTATSLQELLITQLNQHTLHIRAVLKNLPDEE